MFDEMPLSKAIKKVANKGNWNELTKGCSDLFTYHNYQYYYGLMSLHFKSVDFWQTDYIHILESQSAIVEWIKSTALKPYLNCLQDKEKISFENEVLSEIKRYYPVQNNSKILFPFKRMFTIGYK